MAKEQRWKQILEAAEGKGREEYRALEMLCGDTSVDQIREYYPDLYLCLINKYVSLPR